MEMNIDDMIELQRRLVAKLASPAIEGEERKQAARELELITKAIEAYMKIANEEEKNRIEADKVDAEIRKSELEAEVKRQDQKNSLIGNIVRGGCQVGSSAIGAAATIYTVVRIVGAEEKDELVMSKALSFIPKLIKG